MNARKIEPKSLWAKPEVGDVIAGVLKDITESEGKFGPRKHLVILDGTWERHLAVGAYLNQIISDLIVGQGIKVVRVADKPTNKGSPMVMFSVTQWPVTEGEQQQDEQIPPFDPATEPPPEAYLDAESARARAGELRAMAADNRLEADEMEDYLQKRQAKDAVSGGRRG